MIKTEIPFICCKTFYVRRKCWLLKDKKISHEWRVKSVNSLRGSKKISFTRAKYVLGINTHISIFSRLN